jgi:glutathione synthase
MESKSGLSFKARATQTRLCPLETTLGPRRINQIRTNSLQAVHLRQNTMADLIASSGGTTGVADLSGASALGLSPEEVKDLVEQGVAWAGANGMQMAMTPVEFSHVPFSLLPIPYPKSEFEKGVAVGPLFNSLYDTVSRDLDWLYDQIESTLEEDKFTAELVRISKEVEKEGPTQKNYLGIFRSDYMLHEPEGATSAKLLQVELNTIAASFACLGSITSEFHRFIVGRHASENAGVCDYLSLDPFESRQLGSLELSVKTKAADQLEKKLPSNQAMKRLPVGLMTAHRVYCNGSAGSPPVAPGQKPPIVIFVVQPGEVNTVDQRLLEHELWTTHKVKAARKTMAEIDAQGSLSGPERRLFVDGAEVAVRITPVITYCTVA